MKFKGFQLDRHYFLKTKSYTSFSKILEEHLIYFERIDDIIRNERKLDCFSSHWIIGIAKDVPPGIFIRNGKTYLEIKSRDVIFLPAFTILEWFFEVTTQIEWTGYISPLPIPGNIIEKPFLFRNDSNISFKNSADIFDFLLQRQQSQDAIGIEEQAKPSHTALTIKHEIQKNYTSTEGLSSLVTKLNISRMTFSTTFKRAYGLTPIQYQHRLRIFESLRLINLGYSITDALFTVGFSDPGQYIDHFKKILNVNPRNYVPKNIEITK